MEDEVKMEDKGTITIKKSTLKKVGIFLGAIILIVIAVFAYNNFKGPTGAAVVDEVTTETGKVNLVVLNDKRCASCDTTGVVAQLKQLFPDLEVKEVDYGSKEGKKLYESTGVVNLPALLFDDSVITAEGYPQVQRYLENKGGYLSLRIGAKHDPKAEICDNGIDDTGNGKVDCEDETCENKMECREEKLNHLQVFIMSDCPYGRKAVEALKGVVDNFGESIDYEVHYIANEAGDGFNSLHGQYEVDENIIQLCAKEHSPEKWLDYLYCRSTKGVREKDWKECAGEVGVDIEKVEACFGGEEGKNLLREDIKIANGLGISASPTWLANNRYKFSGIDAETVKTNFCNYNEDLEGCKNTLSTDTGGVASGSC